VVAVTVRQALIADTSTVHRLLLEAAAWVDALAAPEDRRRMWEAGELEHEAVAAEVAAGQFHLAEIEGLPAGAIRFQLEDRLFWPDLPEGESAFVHRLVVSRAFKGRGVSSALLQWAASHARETGRSWLRLDCDNDRPKLKALYERFGFRLHSYRHVGPYYVARYEYPLI
jgi:GNAT superfamily N-acetyltransferase